MTFDFSIRAETEGDFDAINAAQLDAFEQDEIIPSLIGELRALNAPITSISLVATSGEGDGAEIIGQVSLSHAWLDTDVKMVDVLVLSPLGVATQFQNQGVGTALIKAAIQAAEATGAPLLFLEGNPKYYGPRGFKKAVDHGFRRPSTRIPQGAFQVVHLSGFEDWMRGTFVYRDVHWKHGVGLYRN